MQTEKFLQILLFGFSFFSCSEKIQPIRSETKDVKFSLALSLPKSPLSTETVSKFPATESVNKYTVTGNTAAEIRNSLNANNPTDGTVHHYDGTTAWYIDGSMLGCSPVMWTINLTITYNMPEWKPPPQTSAALIIHWNSYLNALYAHEYNHGKIALECTKRINEEFEKLHFTSNCKQFIADANALGKSIAKECDKQQNEFDAQTDHGKITGAAFP